MFIDYPSKHTMSQFCFSHLSERLRGFSICSVINEMADSSTIRANALLPSASLSPSWSTGLTRYCRNKLAKTATNSTCENLRPTHSRGPSAHGMKVPGSGSMKVSCVIWDVCMSLLLDGGEETLSQRLGRQARASEPQVSVSVWRAWTFILIPVFGGSTCVLSPRVSPWG